MYKISNKLIITNSLLALSTLTPHNCYAMDKPDENWKSFLNQWKVSTDSSSEEEMSLEEPIQRNQIPQRRPAFSSQAVSDYYYKKRKEASSEDCSSDSEGELHSSRDRKMVLESQTIQTQTERLTPTSTPAKRKLETAFCSSEQSEPKRTLGNQRTTITQPIVPILSPAEQKLRALQIQHENEQNIFEHTANQRKNNLLTTGITEQMNDNKKYYDEAVNRLKVELDQKQKTLEIKLARDYIQLELEQHTEKVNLNLLQQEQKKNILFPEIFLSDNDNGRRGLPLDIWGVIFYHYCQEIRSRSCFSSISKKFNNIARIFTHNIRTPYFYYQNQHPAAQSHNTTHYLSTMSSILPTFPNFRTLTVSINTIPLSDIVMLVPNLNHLILEHALFRENDDFTSLLTNLKSLTLKSLTIHNRYPLHPSFKNKISQIKELDILFDTPPSVSRQLPSLTKDEIKNLTNLTSLKISDNQASDEIIKELTNLTSLTISTPFDDDNEDTNFNFTNDGLKYLTNLVSLDLPLNFTLNINTYNLLTQLQSLNGISLLSNRISCNNLGEIFISKHPIREINENTMRKFTLDSLDKSHIEIINMQNLKFKMSDLKGITNLTSLCLGDQKLFTDNFLKPLKYLINLELNENTRISDIGLSYLPNLQKLSLTESNNKSKPGVFYVTDKGLKMLPNLTYLDLNHNLAISDDGISTLTNLTSLNLRHNEQITNNGIKLLTNLTELRMENNITITAKGVQNLNKLGKIVY